MKCRFVGREYELDALQSLTEKQAASLVVVTGRRRIGKSRLVEEFADRHEKYGRVFISALAPQPGITPARQRKAFAEQMELALGLPPVQHESWLNLFLHLARGTEKESPPALLSNARPGARQRGERERTLRRYLLPGHQLRRHPGTRVAS